MYDVQLYRFYGKRWMINVCYISSGKERAAMTVRTNFKMIYGRGDKFEGREGVLVVNRLGAIGYLSVLFEIIIIFCFE